MTTVVHVTASPFFGGPERQMLGLAKALCPDIRSVFLSFSEEGRCRPFLENAQREGFEVGELRHDTPRFLGAVREILDVLGRHRAEVVCVHGYKAGILGRVAARWIGLPVVAVSRGWTGECFRVRLYESLDRINLRLMNRVVCVSQGQAAKVRKAGLPERKIVVIPNAIEASRFASAEPGARQELESLFPRPPRWIVGAAGRLSTEKGFFVLVDAAERVTRSLPDVGFVLFGEGVLRPALTQQIKARGLSDRFLLAGFRSDLDRLLPSFDLLVQSSFTEGMPNVVLEACAAGVPVVATAVGGTPEIIEGPASDLLVPPGDPEALAERIRSVLADNQGRLDLAGRAREHVLGRFTFTAQAQLYRKLFGELIGAAEPGSEGSALASESRMPLSGAVER